MKPMPKNEWRKSIEPRIDEARSALAAIPEKELARRSGAVHRDGRLSIPVLGHATSVHLPELVAHAADGSVCPEETQILLLDYLIRSDGASPSGEWIGFQELPNGGFYRQAFQGYTGDRLVQEIGGDIEAFRRAAKALGGEAVALGDAAYAFRVLPLVPLAVVWWDGDEEFPPNATVLFDRVAQHSLPTDGLAILGRMLCRALGTAGGSR